MKKTTLWMLLAAFAGALALSACNTAHGFGQDVENTGDYIQHKTNDSND